MSDLDLTLASTLLFVPGDRPDRFDKARAASPDGIVIDLEDAVPLDGKQAARANAIRYIAEAGGGPPILVRLNALDTRAVLDDLSIVAEGGTRPDGVFLAKIDDPRDIEILRAHLPEGTPLVVAIETARGMLAAASICRAMLPRDALAFGGADLATDLGAEFAWQPLVAARATLVAAAATEGLPVFDVPYLDIRDPAGLEAETCSVRAMGFTGKLAIHPSQVGPIRAVFTPGPDDVEKARRVVAAMRSAGGGAVQLDGRMIDVPVARRAERVLRRAGAAATEGGSDGE